MLTAVTLVFWFTLQVCCPVLSPRLQEHRPGNPSSVTCGFSAAALRHASKLFCSIDQFATLIYFIEHLLHYWSPHLSLFFEFLQWLRKSFDKQLFPFAESFASQSHSFLWLVHGTQASPLSTWVTSNRARIAARPWAYRSSLQNWCDLLKKIKCCVSQHEKFDFKETNGFHWFERITGPPHSVAGIVRKDIVAPYWQPSHFKSYQV